MRIVFLGTPEFAVVSLERLLKSQHNVVAVVTIPDKTKGRGLKSRPSAVKKFAITHNLPVLQPVSLKDPSFIETLRQYNADAFVVVAFRILPEIVFNLPPKGTINLHGSYLPKYRGAAPINWAIINGDTWSGVSTILINNKVDTGDLLLQKKVKIDDDMTAGELHDVLAREGAGLLAETLDGIGQNLLKPVKQDDTLASKAPKITKELCRLDFSKPAKDIHNKVRGLSPYPGVNVLIDSQPLKIFHTSLPRTKSSYSYGQLSRINRNSFFIQCADYEIEVLEVQAPGKKRMETSAFLNGHSFLPGVRVK